MFASLLKDPFCIPCTNDYQEVLISLNLRLHCVAFWNQHLQASMSLNCSQYTCWFPPLHIFNGKAFPSQCGVMNSRISASPVSCKWQQIWVFRDGCRLLQIRCLVGISEQILWEIWYHASNKSGWGWGPNSCSRRIRHINYGYWILQIWQLSVLKPTFLVQFIWASLVFAVLKKCMNSAITSFFFVVGKLLSLVRR